MNPETIATYRIQLHHGFDFNQAADIVPYLAKLGISHIYASPYLQAAAGSTHGYDVLNPTKVNEELGGSESHTRLCHILETAGLGHMIDVVPNHMAVTGGRNPWWWDVLENGQSSRFAPYFDIDWGASCERLPYKILLPVLGDHYGRILDNGQFRLSFREGVFILHYQDHTFPVNPSSLSKLLNRAAETCGSELLAFIADSYARLPLPVNSTSKALEPRDRDKKVLVDLLVRVCREEKEAEAAVSTEVECLNSNPDAMDVFIRQQNYRPAFWRMASTELGYRRFFDINELAGLRTEDLEVFRSIHVLPITWARKGWVQGLRIDHPDGLRDPAEYFHRLREKCPDAWIVAEKILESDERLPGDWPIEGTTGYDFLNLVGGLFIDPAGESSLTQFYENFIGEPSDYSSLVRASKLWILSDLLDSEINRLGRLFAEVCKRHRHHRDYTRHELHEVLREVIACFPIYRTYVDAHAGMVSDDDERYIMAAVSHARTERSDLDPELFRFLADLLLLHVRGSLECELVMRFQQATVSAMAKGVEDTAFYRFHRLACLNEVGGNPDRFGISPETFHAWCAEAQARYPRSLLATSTHDTKRSDDVRARLSLISEIPGAWSNAVLRWSQQNERHRSRDMPDRNVEYLFYQALVGAWPIETERMTAYMEKAAREAKVHTSWTHPHDAYEQALRDFVSAAMNDGIFRTDLEDFMDLLLTPGRINSLAQTLIKLTAPGIPDIYQGAELWDLSLVDPDNRRPVDFTLRRRLLDTIENLSPEDVLARMDEGLPKLWIIRQSLHLRRKRPELFGPEGTYRPLYARGSKTGHIVAFVRGEEAITVAPRLIIRLNGTWDDTILQLPAGRWHNILTGDVLAEGPARIREIFARFPVALLTRKE